MERLCYSMYKVLIADDEVKVCKLINNLVEWDQFGLEVAAMVHDGVSALQFIKEEKPDIVITDIRMPGYDGIELIRQAKELNPEINFIIVSGYRQFDYAHNAIKYGVEDYLLKPLKKTEFTNTLTRMIKKREEAVKGQSETEDMKKRLHLDDKILKQAFLGKLMADSMVLKEDVTREEINREYHCGFIEGFYQGVIIKPDLPEENGDEQSYGLLMEKAGEITDKLLGDNFKECLVMTSKEGIVCLVNDSFNRLQELRRYLKQIRGAITTMRDVFLNVRVTIGMGEAVEEVNKIPQTLAGARAAILNRLFEGTGHILFASNVRKEALTPYEIIDTNFKNKFFNYIEALNSGGIASLIKEAGDRLSCCKEADGELILEVCREIYEIFSFGITKSYLSKKNLINQEEYEKHFYRCITLQEVFCRMTQEINGKIDELNMDKKTADKKPIRMAKQYIREKYAQPITLEEVSSQIGFNSTYFSTLFKKETGQNFLEYLTDARIQAAKQLLSDTGRSVNQVAEEVGYIDLKHFAKVFKKSTGLTPSEYRKLYY